MGKPEGKRPLERLSYHKYKIAITITLNQLTLSRYKTALSEVSQLN
jgi:hypothetical protein